MSTTPTTALLAPQAVPAARSIGNPDASELATIERMGDTLMKSGFCKGARSKEQAVALILMGRELGIPAMTALSTIHVIEGKPAASVHLIGGQLARGGVRWVVESHTDKECAIVFHRPGWEPMRVAFTLADAARAGVGNKQVWKNYPRAMLYARAFTEGARIVGPDLLCGIQYTPEELGATVDAEGDVVVLPARARLPVPSQAAEPPVDPPSRAEEPDPPPPDDAPTFAAPDAPPPESERLRDALLGIEKIAAKPHLVSHYRVHYLDKTPKALGLTGDEGRRVIAFLEQRARDFGIAGIPGLKRLASEEAERKANAASESADDREPGSDG